MDTQQAEQQNKQTVTPEPNNSSADLANNNPNGVVVTAEDKATFEAGLELVKQISQLHPVVSSYLMSDALEETRASIYEKYNLTDDEQATVTALEFSVFLKELPAEQFSDALWLELPWDDSDENLEKADNLAIDILGNIFLPVQAFYDGVALEINRLGGDVSKFNVESLAKRTITYEAGIKEILKLLNLGEISDRRNNRLKHIINSRLREVRTDVGMLEMLMKSEKTGGLEMDEATAERIVKMVSQEAKMTNFIEEAGGDPSIIKSDDSETEDKKTFSPEDIKARLVGSAEEQKEIAKRLQQINEESKGKPDLTRELFVENTFVAPESEIDSLDVVAVLLALVGQSVLIDSLEGDERFIKAMNEYLEATNDKQLIDSIKANQSGRVAMNVFLQLILRSYGKLEDEDSARYGFRVSSILKKRGYSEYSDLVAFDVDEEKFVWVDPIEI